MGPDQVQGNLTIDLPGRAAGGDAQILGVEVSHLSLFDPNMVSLAAASPITHDRAQAWPSDGRENNSLDNRQETAILSLSRTNHVLAANCCFS
jgi:hypothetical protein